MGDLEDIEAIRQLVARYCHLADSVDVEPWLDCWTDDGVFDFGGSRTVGRDELRALCEGSEAIYAVTPLRHVVTNVVIDVDGDTATSSSYVQLFVVGQPPTIMSTARYYDRLRRVDGRWRFSERIVRAGRRAPDAGRSRVAVDGPQVGVDLAARIGTRKTICPPCATSWRRAARLTDDPK